MSYQCLEQAALYVNISLTPRSRADHLARAQAFEAQGRLKEARDCYTKCVDVTPEIAFQLIKVSFLVVSCLAH